MAYRHVCGPLACLVVPWFATAPAAAGSRPTEVVVYDMTAALSTDLSDPAAVRRLWDETHLVASLQGIVNRDAPRLYIRYNAPADDFWWERMVEPDGWLEGVRVDRVATIDELLARFAGDFGGAVVWDERVPATSNLASTIAGCDRLVCLRYDEREQSLYQRLTVGPNAPLKVRTRLLADDGGPMFTGVGTVPGTEVPSTGSAKCDAYLWLIEHYVRTGRADPRTMGYYIDGFWLRCAFAGSPALHTLTNHDFVIARRGVFFDLGVWDDETPVDDPSQAPGTDARALRALLGAAYQSLGGAEMIQVCGFIPWAYKYTNWAGSGWSAAGKHDPVPTEWRYAEILSCFNAYMDADAIGLSSMANASFFQHYPLKADHPQNPLPTAETLKQRGILDEDGRIRPRFYYAHYVGDYDSAAWLYNMLPSVWTDPNRGKVPLSWAFNPNLCARFPLGMAWTRGSRTAEDFFVAGDSGAGYLNPGYLTEPRPHSGLPSGLAVWERHCARLYEQWGLSLTGFVIDGYARGLGSEGLDAYARFSPDGIVAQKVPLQGVHNGMPFIRMCADLPDSAQAAARAIDAGRHGRGPRFAVYRSILKPPSWYVAVTDEVTRSAGDGAMVVDLYTLMWLVREYESHPELHQGPASEFAAADEVDAAPAAERGLTAVSVDDGPVSVRTVGQMAAWVIAAHKPPQYLYLDADDSFARSLGGPATITVEYLDSGTGVLAVQYDSTDQSLPLAGAYKEAGRVSRAGSGAWKTADFAVADPRFAGNQNNRCDLRIFSDGDDLAVRRIAIRRAGPGR